MDDLETLLRDTLREHAADAPAVRDLQTSRPSWQPRRLKIALVAAAVLVVVGVATLVAVTRRSPTDHHRAGSGQATSAAPTAPARIPVGMKPVGYHGIEIAVPDDLRVGPSSCSAVRAPGVVVLDGMDVYCPMTIPPDPRAVVVRLAAFDPAHATSIYAGLHRATVNGLQVRRSETVTAGYPPRIEITVAVPLGALVRITAPRTKTGVARAIAMSVRRAVVDTYGCPDRFRPLDASNGRGGLAVPPHVVSAVVCRYGTPEPTNSTPTPNIPYDGWLLGSATLSTSQRRLVVDAVGHARGGILDLFPFATARVVFRYADGSTYALDITSVSVTDGTTSAGLPQHVSRSIDFLGI